MQDKALEAAAQALWEKHYRYGPESVGEAATKRWRAASDCSRREYLADAQVAIAAYLAQREAEGFVMVPVEPSEEMLESGLAEFTNIRDIWAAMIAARPRGDRNA